MSMEYIRKNYGVPANRGRRFQSYVFAAGKWTLVYEGRITSATHYIRSKWARFHPTSGIVYLNEDGTVLMDTRNP